MHPSTAFCRAQECLQRERAAGSTLPNVREVAHRAANAWAIEALLADQREQRQLRVSAAAAELARKRRRAHEQLDRELSENPDRGLAYA